MRPALNVIRARRVGNREQEDRRTGGPEDRRSDRSIGPSVHRSIGHRINGQGGIRTHDTVAGMPVFKTGAFNHSATCPGGTLL